MSEFDFLGNLKSREKNWQSFSLAQREEFEYHALNRLKVAKLTQLNGRRVCIGCGADWDLERRA